jgi:hypothetical protein
MIQQIMDRMLATPDFAAMARAEDLGPLCMAVQQATMSGGKEALAVTIMVAAWGIADYVEASK